MHVVEAIKCLGGVGVGGGFPAHPAESQVKSFGFQSQLKDEEINPQANKSSWARQRPMENTRGQVEGKPRPMGSRTKVLAGGEQGAWSGLV